MRQNSLLATAISAHLLTPAQAALYARDINHDRTPDRLYDTDLNIMWLRGGGLSSLWRLRSVSTWADRLATSHRCYVELTCTAPHLLKTDSFQKLAFTCCWSGRIELTESGQLGHFQQTKAHIFGCVLSIV